MPTLGADDAALRGLHPLPSSPPGVPWRSERRQPISERHLRSRAVPRGADCAMNAILTGRVAGILSATANILCYINPPLLNSEDTENGTIISSWCYQPES